MITKINALIPNRYAQVLFWLLAGGFFGRFIVACAAFDHATGMSVETYNPPAQSQGSNNGVPVGASGGNWLDDLTGMSVTTYQRGPDYREWTGGNGNGVYFTPKTTTSGTSSNRIIDAGKMSRQQLEYTLELGRGLTETGRFIYAPSTQEFFGTNVQDGIYEYDPDWTETGDHTLQYGVEGGRVTRFETVIQNPY